MNSPGGQPMFKHVVMWKLMKKIGNQSKGNLARQMKDRLETLPGKIDEIREYEVGINIGESSAAFDIVLISGFDNVDEFNSYRKHPAHQRVVDFIQTIQSEARVVDYETD